MCSKRLRTQAQGDWVVAYRLHRGIPVTVPADRGERLWLAGELIDTYGWSVSRAAYVLSLRTVDLAVTA